ncbi:hypothetical protein JCM16418A_31300 [Paenibacillus pini]|uniref:Uncharacterized protein n=1 Tax=Paenibacillus pini JCM 16418 TaxID=1236976 RepID=W7YIT3_9BACL|nr:hypothetical protein JCM16418_2445 [Paenibacillus pini JCM 16418]
MPTFDSIQVTGSATVQQDLQVGGNETIAQSLNVNGSETVNNHLAVGGTITSGQGVNTLFRLGVWSQPTLPGGTSSVQQVIFYPTGSSNQPGLLLQGTDGLNYVLFIDVSSGTANLAIQRV